MRYYEWVYIVHANRPTSSFSTPTGIFFRHFSFQIHPFKLAANQENHKRKTNDFINFPTTSKFFFSPLHFLCCHFSLNNFLRDFLSIKLFRQRHDLATWKGVFRLNCKNSKEAETRLCFFLTALSPLDFGKLIFELCVICQQGSPQ